MSPEERQAKRAKATAAQQSLRQRKNASMATDESRAEESSGDYEIPVTLTHPIQQACKHDQERIMHVDGKPNTFQAAVCVLCDRLIKGCESIHKTSA